MNILTRRHGFFACVCETEGPCLRKRGGDLWVAHLKLLHEVAVLHEFVNHFGGLRPQKFEADG
jgi:hypothetical protein